MSGAKTVYPSTLRVHLKPNVGKIGMIDNHFFRQKTPVIQWFIDKTSGKHHFKTDDFSAQLVWEKYKWLNQAPDQR